MQTSRDPYAVILPLLSSPGTSRLLTHLFERGLDVSLSSRTTDGRRESSRATVDTIRGRLGYHEAVGVRQKRQQRLCCNALTVNAVVHLVSRLGHAGSVTGATREPLALLAAITCSTGSPMLGHCPVLNSFSTGVASRLRVLLSLRLLSLGPS